MTSSSVVRKLTVVVAAGSAALLGAMSPPGPPPGPGVLELGATLEPPPLSEFSYAVYLRRQLEDEIVALYHEERSAQDPRRAALRAGINYRIMAAELLVQGDEAGAADWLSAFTGLRLAHGRSLVDAVILPAAPPGAPPVIGADEAGVDRFNEDVIDLAHRLRTVDPAQLDRATARIMWSLARALHPALEVEAVSHWPVVDVAGARPAPAAPPIATVDELRARIESGALRSETRAIVLEILDFLERGARFADMRAAVDTLRDQVADLLDFADAITAATWMSDALRTDQLEAAHEVAAMLRDPSARAEGARALATLARRGAFVGRLGTLRELRGDPRPLATALLSGGDPGVDEAARLERLGAILERMIRYRQLAPAELPRDLKIAMGKLGQAYQAAEEAVVDRLDDVVRADGLSDPAVSSLVADQAQYLADVGRLSRSSDWAAAIEALDSRVAPAFQRQLRKMSRWLLDPNRRPDAVIAMSQFEAQLAMISPLAFEEELETRTPAAIIATGGRDEELLVVIRETKRAWAQAWGRGDAGSAPAARLVLLSQLAQTMAGCAEVLDPDEEPVRLGRWAAWETPRSMIARGSAEIPNRLKLATAAAVDGNDGQVAAQLERLDRDAPITRLIGRLSVALESELAPLPDGLVGLLGQLLYPPRDDAWMLDARPELARLCRYAMEADHAWAEGRDEEGELFQEYVNARAAAMLRQLDARGRLVPQITGFDGSDPGADG